MRAGNEQQDAAQPHQDELERVAARLKAYDLVIDDSAGVPVARTLPGAFLDLVLSAAESDFAPPKLMALLKHPLTLIGRSPGDIREDARILERIAFRDVYGPVIGLDRRITTTRDGRPVWIRPRRGCRGGAPAARR